MAMATFRDATGAAYVAEFESDSNGQLTMVVAVRSAVPTVDKCETLAVGTTAENLSSVTGGIPTASTHALLSVPPGGGDIYYTDDGVLSPDSGTGIYVPAGAVAELTNLSLVELIADPGAVTVTLSFRHY